MVGRDDPIGRDATTETMCHHVPLDYGSVAKTHLTIGADATPISVTWSHQDVADDGCTVAQHNRTACVDPAAPQAVGGVPGYGRRVAHPDDGSAVDPAALPRVAVLRATRADPANTTTSSATMPPPR